jgi:hypothetical protein
MPLKDRKTLKLILKAKWFRMIESGIKLEDYREIKPFYASRLKNKPEYALFQLGYSKNARKMKFRISGIFQYFPQTLFTITHLEAPINAQLRAKFGKSCEKEWGFEKDKNLYIIRLGDRIYPEIYYG